MTDRVRTYRPGGNERDRPTDTERAEADMVEPTIEATRAFLAERPAPDLTGHVLHRIASLQPPASPRRVVVLRQLARLVWTPVRISIRPAYALAAAAIVAATFTLVPLRQPDPSAAAADPSSRPPVYVQFRLEADAASVQLAGSFSNWERHTLHEAAPGFWSITVPLSQGVHDYAFLVDGRRWVADPYASQVRDGFGGTNSRLTLLLSGTPRS